MRETYYDLIQEHPFLFNNPPDCQLEVLLNEKEIQEAEQITKRSVGIMYEDSYIYLLRDAIKSKDGSYGTYIRLLHKNLSGGTVILPITDDKKIVLIKHFRHSIRDFCYEIPRGFQESKLTSEENAQNELKEEINAIPLELIYLGNVLADSGLLGSNSSIYCAKITADQLEINDDGEGISHIVLLSYDELVKKILDGEIQDSYTLTALYLARLHQLI